jgi:hypothetical protein
VGRARSIAQSPSDAAHANVNGIRLYYNIFASPRFATVTPDFLERDLGPSA